MTIIIRRHWGILAYFLQGFIVEIPKYLSDLKFCIYQDGDLLIGAPGPYNWRGAVFKNRIVQSLTESSRWYQSPVEDPHPTADDMPEPATNYYSYLGSSLPFSFECSMLDCCDKGLTSAYSIELIADW